MEIPLFSLAETKFEDVKKEWFRIINNIFMPCDKILDFLNSSNEVAYKGLADFLTLLRDIALDKESRNTFNQRFLNLLMNVSENKSFNEFYGNQIALFKAMCGFALNGLTEKEINKVYDNLRKYGNLFVYKASEFDELVEKETKTIRAESEFRRIQDLWKKRTDSDSPANWSKEHSTPILILVDDNEFVRAKKVFQILNEGHELIDSEEVSSFLEETSLFEKLGDDSFIDECFRTKILEEYSSILDPHKVRENLSETEVEPYDWFESPIVKQRIRKLAEDTNVIEEACRIIADMDLTKLRNYVEQLIRGNLHVGMAIVHSSKQEVNDV